MVVTPIFKYHFLCCVERGTIAKMYHDRDIFDLSQGHVNQPMTVPV